MERLADTELQMALELSGEHSTMRRIAEECIAHRASLRADAERVKAVVEPIAAHVLGPNHPALGWVDAASAIATRVSEQLASAVPVLSAEERETAKTLRSTMAEFDFLPEVPRVLALLDRLLGAAP